MASEQIFSSDFKGFQFADKEQDEGSGTWSDPMYRFRYRI